VSHEVVSQQIRALIRDVPNFPKQGIVFKDLTPVFLHGPTQRAMCNAFADRYRNRSVDAFVAIESRGFIVGAPMAVELGAGMVLLRKPGKLPRETYRQEYSLEYGTDVLEMHQDALKPGARVVVVDDLLATGGTAKAACDLLQKAGAEIIEAAFIVELSFLGGRGLLGQVPIFSMVSY